MPSRRPRDSLDRVVIRECEEQDIESLERHLPTGHNHAHAAHFQRQRDGQWTLLIAWVDEIPCGTCVVNWAGPTQRDVRATFPDCAELCFLQVPPRARNQGIGTALVAAAEERAIARGMSRVGLGVDTANPDAARLYRRLGYDDTGLTSTTEYTWWDESGVGHDLVEIVRFLVKELD